MEYLDYQGATEEWFFNLRGYMLLHQHVWLIIKGEWTPTAYCF